MTSVCPIFSFKKSIVLETGNIIVDKIHFSKKRENYFNIPQLTEVSTLKFPLGIIS